MNHFSVLFVLEELSCGSWTKAIKEERIIVNEVSVDVN